MNIEDGYNADLDDVGGDKELLIAKFELIGSICDYLYHELGSPENGIWMKTVKHFGYWLWPVTFNEMREIHDWNDFHALVGFAEDLLGGKIKL
jgi:hypothetical protein